MNEVIFGSIGTLAETSDMQREAFNAAFRDHGLGWHWDQHEYSGLLQHSGGRARVAEYAKARGESVDADSVHARKSQLFQQALGAGVPLRSGVAETMALARDRGWRLALATGTSPENVAAVLTATGLSHDRFDVICDATAGLPAKPAPDVFLAALAGLDATADDALAIEDNPDGFAAATAAGLRCIALPGAMHAPAAFKGAVAIQRTLDLRPLLPANER